MGSVFLFLFFLSLCFACKFMHACNLVSLFKNGCRAWRVLAFQNRSFVLGMRDPFKINRTTFLRRRMIIGYLEPLVYLLIPDQIHTSPIL